VDGLVDGLDSVRTFDILCGWGVGRRGSASASASRINLLLVGQWPVKSGPVGSRRVKAGQGRDQKQSGRVKWKYEVDVEIKAKCKVNA